MLMMLMMLMVDDDVDDVHVDGDNGKLKVAGRC